MINKQTFIQFLKDNDAYDAFVDSVQTHYKYFDILFDEYVEIFLYKGEECRLVGAAFFHDKPIAQDRINWQDLDTKWQETCNEED